jgi:Ca2+-binding EF-hand superfamily protein
MISLETENRLATLIVGIADQEREVEIVRQVLCEQPLFETYSAFQRIDRNKRGYISTRDIYKFTSENNSLLTEKQIAMIIRCYDKNHESKLSYADFLELALPKNNGKLRAQVCQREIYKVGTKEKLAFDVEYTLCRLFEKEGTTLKELEKVKERLTTRFDFNGAEAFKCIDKANHKYISGSEICTFLHRAGYAPSIEGIEFLLNRLDKNRDGLLSYSEFAWAFTPMDEDTKIIPSYASPTRTSLARIEVKRVSATHLRKDKSVNKSLNQSFYGNKTTKPASAIQRYKGFSTNTRKGLAQFLSNSQQIKKGKNKITPFSVYA